jgi:hypothetical protein
MDPEIPEALLKKHPELEQIHAAMAEYRQTGVVTTRCPRCQEPIKVVEVPGRLVVSCPCGLCRYSLKFDIDATPTKK